jgi:hypothetical protein
MRTSSGVPGKTAGNDGFVLRFGELVLETEYHYRMDGDRRREAANRLRHDLGRYIRFWAPEELEADTGALRDRLARDVLATRAGPAEVLPAAAIFDAWVAEEGRLFERSGELRRLREAIDEMRGLAGRLPELGRAELERLDELTRVIARECRKL